MEAIYMKEQPNKETSTRRGQQTEGTLYKGDIHAEGSYVARHSWILHIYG